MTGVSILTTQNVTIDYVLAGFGQRIAAFLLDFFILVAWVVLHWMLGNYLFQDETSRQIYAYLVILPFVSFYTLLTEQMLNGQTPGKKALGIRVIKLNGKEPEFIDYFIRWSLRFVEIYLSSGVIATVMIHSTERKQRIADLIAGTVLVKIRVRQSIQVDDLVRISNQSAHQAKYPQVVQFREEDMLLLKKLIDRLHTCNNKAHQSLVKETAEKLAARMGVAIRDETPEMFIKSMIRDYVVLTR